MATTYTTNYNLGKQENHADKFDMDVITDNADKIDAALTAKADKSTTYTKTEVDTALSGKQATLTTAQLDAVNSGITSADVTQIGVNENNILSLAPNGGGINKATINDGSGTGTMIIPCDPITGHIVVKFAEFTSTDTDTDTSVVQFIYTDDSTSGGLVTGRGTNLRATATIAKTVKSIKLFASDSTAHSSGDSFTFSGLELCAIADDELPYQPYAPNNAALYAMILALQPTRSTKSMVEVKDIYGDLQADDKFVDSDSIKR